MVECDTWEPAEVELVVGVDLGDHAGRCLSVNSQTQLVSNQLRTDGMPLVVAQTKLTDVRFDNVDRRIRLDNSELELQHN